MSGPLGGVRVLDVSRGPAAGFATRLLALLGARVTAVRLPNAPRLEPGLGEFLSAHKARRRVDPRTADGRHTLAELLGEADAVVLDVPRARREAWGLGEARLAASFPRLVAVEIGGLDGSMPWADRPHAEILWQAAGGWASLTGAAGRPPLALPGYPASYLTGAHAALVVCALLYERGRTGRAGAASVSAVEAIAGALEGALARYGATGEERTRCGPGHHRFSPMGLFPVRDGSVMVCVPTDAQWQDLVSLLGASDLADPALARLDARRALENTIAHRLRRHLAGWTREDWFRATQEWRLPCAPCLGFAEVLNDPHLSARGFFRAGRRGVRPGSPWRTRRTPSRGRRAGRDDPADRLVDLPLAGTRVVELASMWAGPYAALLLQDLGATVWKVEAPFRPDGTRGGDPAAAPFFHELNRGKYGLALDLRSRHGRADLLRLAAYADVVLENFSPRVMPNLGLSFPVMRRANPDLISLAMPAFGRSGPYRDYVAYGGTLQSLSGIVGRGYADGERYPAGIALSDAVVGVLGAVAVTAALYRRETCGGGTEIELSQWEGLLQLVGEGLVRASHGMNARALPDDRRRRGAGPVGIYACEDGGAWLAVACNDAHEAAALRALMRRGDAPGIRGPRSEREIEGDLARWTLERSAEAAAAELAAAGVPAVPVLGVADLYESRALAAQDFWVEVEDESGRRFNVPGPPWRLAGRPRRRTSRPGPRLGADNASILGSSDRWRRDR